MDTDTVVQKHDVFLYEILFVEVAGYVEHHASPVVFRSIVDRNGADIVLAFATVYFQGEELQQGLYAVGMRAGNL